MMYTERDNYLRNARFQHPRWIPCTIAVSGATIKHLGRELASVMERHPLLFPNFTASSTGWEPRKSMEEILSHAKRTHVDEWGCRWEYGIEGLEGVVTTNPLEDWDALEQYAFPSPRIDLDAIRSELDRARREGNVLTGSVPHGFLFLRLTYLRGFENALCDFASEDPRMQLLIDRITGYYQQVVSAYLSLGIDVMQFADDLGTQHSTILSPAQLRKWIFPAYRQLTEPCRQKGVLVYLHSDGKTLDILEDQIAAGVDIVNPQDLCNGIDELARVAKGKVCIQLDIDRQTILPYGSRQEIFELIEEEVRKLGSPEGGLEFIAGIYPPTPPENIDALCCALEKYRTYWWE